MGEQSSKLAGKQVLVVEDEYFIASDLARMLEQGGACVVGPVSNADSALSLIAECSELDGAILDIKLDIDRDVYPVAEILAARNVPFVFATGYDKGNVRRDFADVPHFSKPLDVAGLSEALFSRITDNPADR